MKPRFNHRSSIETHELDEQRAQIANPATLPQLGVAAVKSARGMRSAWLKLQLFVADVRHHNKLRML